MGTEIICVAETQHTAELSNTTVTLNPGQGRSNSQEYVELNTGCHPTQYQQGPSLMTTSAHSHKEVVSAKTAKGLVQSHRHKKEDKQR